MPINFPKLGRRRSPSIDSAKIDMAQVTLVQRVASKEHQVSARYPVDTQYCWSALEEQLLVHHVQYMLLYVVICRYMLLDVVLCRFMLLYVTIGHYMSLYIAISRYMSIYVAICCYKS